MNQVSSAFQPRTRLTEARLERGLSQREVADYLGTTAVNVSRWERGITRPIPYYRQKLCTLFEKAAWELDLAQRVPGAITPETLRPGADSQRAQESPLHPQHIHDPIVYGVPAPGPGARPPAAISSSAIIDPAIPVPSATHLIGREAELARMRSRLRSGVASAALVALNGLPGVGKTALAIAIAHDPEVRAHFKDGVLWAGLGPEPNIQNHLNRWGTLLGLSQAKMSGLSSLEAWAATLRMAIGSRSMLIIIDDAWTVEEALMLKVGGIHCAHLMTTRFPVLAAQVAAYGATLIKALHEQEGIALLRLLAPQVVEAEPERARELVEAVGGLPLALTLMGNYLRAQAATGQPRSIAAALHQLSHARERLDLSELHGSVASHSGLPGNTPNSLRSIIALTDQYLPDRARHALHAFSVFPPRPNSFSEVAALAVAACPVETLDELTDSGLLEINSSGRLTLHQIIADYARQQLHEGADARRVQEAPLHLQHGNNAVERAPALAPGAMAAYQRLIAYTTTFVEAHRKDYEALEGEINNILATLEAAFTCAYHAELMRVAVAFAPFLLARGLYAPAEMHLRRAYDAALAGQDHHGLAGILLYLGEMTWKRGDYDQAGQYLQAGLNYARQINDHERICAILANLGSLSWKSGDYKQARAYLQEGLALARELGNLERVCDVLQILGCVERVQGNFTQAETYLQEGLELARQIGERELTCPILLNLGGSAAEQGKYAQAETYYQEGLRLARQLQHSEWISGFLNNLGDITSEQGDYEQAARYFHEGLELARQIEHREWTSFLLLNLGITVRKQRKYALSETCLRESLALARQIGIPQITCYVLNEYGNLHLEQQQPELAKINFREILAIVPEGGQDFIAFARYGLARVAAARGELVEARALGEQSRAALEGMGRREAQEVESWLRSLQDSRIAAAKSNQGDVTLHPPC